MGDSVRSVAGCEGHWSECQMTKVYTYVLVGRFQELKDVTTSGKESVCSSLSIRSDGTDLFIEQFHSG